MTDPHIPDTNPATAPAHLVSFPNTPVQLPARPPHTPNLEKLAEALAKAQAEIEHAAKAVDNTYFRSKYADLPAVYDASRKPLAMNGLSVVQVTEFDEKDRMTLVTTLLHSSGQWMRSWYPIRPAKNDPQSIGSALTYARRYAYSAMVGVAAHDEDDDGNAASGRDKKEEPAGKSLFANAAIRKQFQANVTKGYQEAATLDELKQRLDLDMPKMEEMKAGGNEHDLLLLEELRKQYALAKERIVQGEREEQMMRDGFGQGFAETHA